MLKTPCAQCNLKKLSKFKTFIIFVPNHHSWAWEWWIIAMFVYFEPSSLLHRLMNLCSKLPKMRFLLIYSAVSAKKLMVWWALYSPLKCLISTKKSNCWIDSVKSYSVFTKNTEKLPYERCWVSSGEFSNLQWQKIDFVGVTKNKNLSYLFVYDK